MKPYISIVTATYNSVELLQRCLDSVASQTFRAIEHIVIDGASTDGTVEIIKANKEKIAYWVSEPDTGIYNAWNKAVSHIRGEWVLFLGSDDKLVNETALEKIAPYLEDAYPIHGLVYGILLVSQRGTEETLFPVGEPWANLKGRYSRANILLPPHPAAFQHISLFNGVETFDETFKIAGDSKFVTQEVLKRDPLFVPVEVTRFSLGGLSWTPGRGERMIWKEERNISKELGIKVAFPRLFINYLKAIIKDNIHHYLGEKVTLVFADVLRMFKFKKPIYLFQFRK
mgnify:CR=1 FL=1